MAWSLAGAVLNRCGPLRAGAAGLCCPRTPGYFYFVLYLSSVSSFSFLPSSAIFIVSVFPTQKSQLSPSSLGTLVAVVAALKVRWSFLLAAGSGALVGHG